MAQKLILPINKTRVTAGYKNPNYKKEFGYNHYGSDLTDQNKSDKTVWGSGNGVVTHVGWSNSCGNVICAVYKNCLLTNGQVKDLTIRYYHLEKINVKAGDKITKDTRLGLYGSTGASTGDHLHIEIDTDTKYPNYTPQIGKNSGVLQAGADSTINPTTALYVKTTSPDNQSVKNSGYNTVASSDLSYQKY